MGRIIKKRLHAYTYIGIIIYIPLIMFVALYEVHKNVINVERLSIECYQCGKVIDVERLSIECYRCGKVSDGMLSMWKGYRWNVINLERLSMECYRCGNVINVERSAM